MSSERDELANADQPPEVDIHREALTFPPAENAAERILEFVSWFGDGEVIQDQYEGDNPPLYARDLEAAAKSVLAKPRQVTTVAELDALPAGTAVQTSDDSDVVVLRSMFGPWRNQDGGEVSTDDLWRYGTKPFTVLYSPVVGK